MILPGLTKKQLGDFQKKFPDLCRAIKNGDLKRLNELLVAAIESGNYKATRRYAPCITHEVMDITDGTDVEIVKLVSSEKPEVAAAAMKFLRHLASVACEKQVKEGCGPYGGRGIAISLGSYVSTKAVAEIIRLLASKDCRSFAKGFFMQFHAFFPYDEEIASALNEVCVDEDAAVRKAVEELNYLCDRRRGFC